MPTTTHPDHKITLWPYDTKSSPTRVDLSKGKRLANATNGLGPWQDPSHTGWTHGPWPDHLNQCKIDHGNAPNWYKKYTRCVICLCCEMVQFLIVLAALGYRGGCHKIADQGTGADVTKFKWGYRLSGWRSQNANCISSNSPDVPNLSGVFFDWSILGVPNCGAMRGRWASYCIIFLCWGHFGTVCVTWACEKANLWLPGQGADL